MQVCFSGSIYSKIESHHANKRKIASRKSAPTATKEPPPRTFFAITRAYIGTIRSGLLTWRLSVDANRLPRAHRHRPHSSWRIFFFSSPGHRSKFLLDCRGETRALYYGIRRDCLLARRHNYTPKRRRVFSFSSGGDGCTMRMQVCIGFTMLML